MKLVRRSIALLFLWLGSSVFISGPNRIVEAAEPDKINVCYSSIAATSITTWVPKEAGIYKKYGLDVSIIYVAGAQAITTLISGDTQIVQGSGAAAALSRLSGSDLNGDRNDDQRDSDESGHDPGHCRATGSKRQNLRRHSLWIV